MGYFPCKQLRPFFTGKLAKRRGTPSETPSATWYNVSSVSPWGVTTGSRGKEYIRRGSTNPLYNDSMEDGVNPHDDSNSLRRLELRRLQEASVCLTAAVQEITSSRTCPRYLYVRAHRTSPLSKIGVWGIGRRRRHLYTVAAVFVGANERLRFSNRRQIFDKASCSRSCTAGRVGMNQHTTQQFHPHLSISRAEDSHCKEVP